MKDEERATGAHGYQEIPPDQSEEFVVVNGWGRGLRVVRAATQKGHR